MELLAIGTVQSTLDERAEAPKQGNEGAPDAWITIEARFAEALDGLSVDDDVFVFTWLHRSSREVLTVHPRDDPSNPLQGVFATRSPDRPNPVGLHRVRILAMDGNRLQVRNLEALDGTPVIDIKPVIGADEQRT
jgi:tRNA-Thr(GGU) m(6)t(6)A37 methyltransferase TsaA